MADDAATPTETSTDPGETVAEAETEAVADTEAETDGGAEPATATREHSHVTLALIVGVVLVIALGGLTGWLGYRANASHQVDAQRQLFLQVGRQGALNLTTIDFAEVDQDVQRILDSATGQFYDDFQQRSQPFAEVVKQVKSKSTGAVTEAGLLDYSPEGAQVLVAVTVNTAVEGQPDQTPRAWRMRITVQKVGDDEAKVSNVEFVP